MKDSKQILLYVLFLPIFLMRDIFRSNRSLIKKIGWILLILILFLRTWWGAVNEVKSIVDSTFFDVGILDKITHVPVSGTSMLPTIKDGEDITLHSPKKYGLARGDVVSFTNEATGGLHYLKRIVGLPQEQISIKNGYVYINNQPIVEKYTLNKLPSFGNTFLADCEVVTVPKGHFFVMGDNRTVSFDSRAIGFVDKEDIDGVIKSDQKLEVLNESQRVTIVPKSIQAETFLKKLNDTRYKEKISLLVTHTTLNQLATQRAKEISDNFVSWKKDSVPVADLLDKIGYRYNLVHEYVTFGYLDEATILSQILESTTQKDEFLSTKYTEVGIGVAEKTDGECTYPVISIILSWPSVPTYDQKVVDGWLREVTVTNQLLSNMQGWVGAVGADQDKVRTIIQYAAEENQIATRIYDKMKKSEWLTQKDYQDVKRYDELVILNNQLVNEFFRNSIQGITTYPEGIRRL